MRSLSSSFTLIPRYLLVLVLVAVTTALLFLLRTTLNSPSIALLYLLQVGLATTLWGLGPGIFSALCTFLSFNYFFIQPYYTLQVRHSSDVLVLLILLVVSVSISQLVGSARAGMTAATAREREATQLYELSTALTGLQDDFEIVRIIAERIQAVSGAEGIEIHISRTPPIKVELPGGMPLPPREPELAIPIQSARGRLGEIRLWRSGASIPASERRLLQTFASQGALALERAQLAQIEGRAKLLEESDRLKSAILSSVSHELRTPLATIKAAVTSLRSGEVNWASPARPDLLTAIDDETDRLNILVGNLLDMSRIEAGALQPQRQWNLLPEIIEGVLARMKNQTERHKVQVEVPEDLPLLPVDYVQMEQVFTNLISNSVKYAPLGSLIQIRARLRDAATVLVQVVNQSPPIPTEHLERIFDKFYRVTDADRVTGTGLGLSICKGIIEAHGGRIWAENLPSGFAFNFILPLLRDGAPPPRLPPDTETE